MSFTLATAIQRRRALLLASTFLIPALWLGVSNATAQQTAPADKFPPIEVNPPGDANRTRAKPATDQTPTSRRVVPRTSSRPDPNAVPAPGPAADYLSH